MSLSTNMSARRQFNVFHDGESLSDVQYRCQSDTGAQMFKMKDFTIKLFTISFVSVTPNHNHIASVGFTNSTVKGLPLSLQTSEGRCFYDGQIWLILRLLKLQGQSEHQASTSVTCVSEKKNFNRKNFFYTSVTEVEKVSWLNVDRKTFTLSVLKSFPCRHGRWIHLFRIYFLLDGSRGIKDSTWRQFAWNEWSLNSETQLISCVKSSESGFSSCQNPPHCKPHTHTHTEPQLFMYTISCEGHF